MGPNTAKVSFVVEARRSGSVPASLLVPALRELERASGIPILFVSDYTGPVLRDTLASEGFSFADATGWIRVASADPLVLLTGQCAARSPRPSRTSAVTRLNGLAASRTIRALATAALPARVRRLAGLADVSPGSVSKLLVTLASEGIVDRDATGGVVAVRRRALLRRWVVDYSFATTNTSVGYYIAPRGLERTLARLDDQMNVAVTGSAAARRLLPDSSTSVVPLRLLAIYAARPAELVGELGLIDAEPATANVVIARPQDPDILTQPHQGGLVTAPLQLVIADLLTLPGRSDAEAEQLMDALAVADEAWKEC
ncbi:MAG TPA: helix-turn-helix domain-containing protein [Aldersonia sp.]